MVGVAGELLLVHEAAFVVEHANRRRTGIGGGEQRAVRRPRQAFDIAAACVDRPQERVAPEVEQVDAVSAAGEGRRSRHGHAVVAGDRGSVQSAQLIRADGWAQCCEQPAAGEVPQASRFVVRRGDENGSAAFTAMRRIGPVCIPGSSVMTGATSAAGVAAAAPPVAASTATAKPRRRIPRARSSMAAPRAAGGLDGQPVPSNVTRVDRLGAPTNATRAQPDSTRPSALADDASSLSGTSAQCSTRMRQHIGIVPCVIATSSRILAVIRGSASASAAGISRCKHPRARQAVSEGMPRSSFHRLMPVSMPNRSSARPTVCVTRSSIVAGRR